MTQNNSTDPFDLKPRINVIGIGGAGGNAVNNMIRAKLEGVDFIIANTDAQALNQSLVPVERRLQLGLDVTQGLGAGSKPDVGRAAAEESIEEVMVHVKGSNMLFITAGMGGGTGTGAAPVIARAARENGILTVGVVTKPFQFEGVHRMRSAERGIEELQQYVDTLIIIPNQNLFRLANEKTTFADAFKMADDVLYSGVRGITDLMIMPGLINLDFADIRAVMAEMGKAMMGTGEAEGERRALDAAEAAISNPLLDDVSMKGAKGVLINITGGYDMTLYEVDEAANRIREDVEVDANIIFGSTFDERLNGKIRVSVVATGIGGLHHQTSPINNISMPKDDINASTQLPKNVNPFLNLTRQDQKTSFANNDETVTQAKSLVDNFEDQSQDGPLNSVDTFASNNELSEDNIFANDKTKSHHGFNEQQIEKKDFDVNKVIPKKKQPSLFERIAGVGRSKNSQNYPSSTSGFKQRDDNELSNTDDNNTNNFSSVKSSKDNEILDIPAFLRRGNNS